MKLQLNSNGASIQFSWLKHAELLLVSVQRTTIGANEIFRTIPLALDKEQVKQLTKFLTDAE